MTPHIENNASEWQEIPMATVRIEGTTHLRTKESANPQVSEYRTFGVPHTIQIGGTTRKLSDNQTEPEGWNEERFPEVWQGEVNVLESQIEEIEVLGWVGLDEGGILETAIVIQHEGEEYQLVNQ